jgi:uncharacterized protein DUF6894
MAHVYFHCSNKEGTLIDRRGSTMGDLTEAREHGDVVIRSLIMAPGAEDWRGWVLHISDDLGDLIFSVPFVSVLGKLH